MINLKNNFSVSDSDVDIKNTFMKWQCRVRQIIMRNNYGKPDASIMPNVFLNHDKINLGKIITVLSKDIPFSKLPEMKHISKVNFDLSKRREKAIQLFSEYYYQNYKEFSPVLTATFQPDSLGAKKIIKSTVCSLVFEAYNHNFKLDCEVELLRKEDPLYQATWWHNSLFNSSLHPDTLILAFNVNWSSSLDETIGGFYE